MTKHVLGTPLPYSFEGETIFGVAKADRYLAQKYGNYMQIPPEAQRRQHRFHYLDLHSPYREYSNS